MSLRDLIAADVTTVFLNVNDFGQTVKRVDKQTTSRHRGDFI